VIGANILTLHKSLIRKSASMVYPINHSAVHADGARDELHPNDERHIGEINNELLELIGNISEHHIGEINKELSELIGKSHLSFQM
jgi:hypothetical protein